MITIRQKGDFKALSSYLERAKGVIKLSRLDKYGRRGVDLLQRETPKDTGKTAASWRYEIKRTSDGARLTFTNSNIQEGVNIAMIIQTGHRHNSGVWIEGRDYINPVVQPLFDQLAKEVWDELK